MGINKISYEKVKSMNKITKVWVVVYAVFWATLFATYLIDTSGVAESSNIGFFEGLWISWIAFTVGLGVILVILIRLVAKNEARQIFRRKK